MYTQTILEHVHTNDSGTSNHKRWWIVHTCKTLEFVHTKDWEHAETRYGEMCTHKGWQKLDLKEDENVHTKDGEHVHTKDGGLHTHTCAHTHTYTTVEHVYTKEGGTCTHKEGGMCPHKR